MLILLGVLLGNIIAMVIHGFAWFLRVKHLRYIKRLGIFGLFLWLAVWCSFEVLELRSIALHPDELFWSGPFWRLQHVIEWAFNFLYFTFICGGVLYPIASLQRRWFKLETTEAMWAILGELTLIFMALCAWVFYCALTATTILQGAPLGGFESFFCMWLFLTFLRPLWWRWGRPFWQVVTEIQQNKK